MNRTIGKYLIGFLVLLIIEVLISLHIYGDFIRPYIGDVLVVIGSVFDRLEEVKESTSPKIWTILN